MRNRVEASAADTGGRTIARRLAVPVLLLTAIARVAPASEPAEPRVVVEEREGTYTVAATFAVPQPASAVAAVLTDYEQIPRIMPDVRTSAVLERSADRTVVEQEAVARFMMFSKRVHLVLDVEESGTTIRFRDRCGKSFELYEGAWSLAEHDGGTAVAYRLTARPSFEVPDFLLKRLLKRDSVEMIGRLRAAIEQRR